MINNAVLVGRLTNDPDLRYTSSGQAVATFTLAVNRNFTNASGEREADFINCVIWRKQAENLANFAKKGSLVGITGRVQTRNYENQQGQRIYVTEIVAEQFQMLESRNKGGNNQDTGVSNNNHGNYTQGRQNGYNNQNNANNNMPNFDRDNSDPFGANSIDISDDSLPF